MEGVLKKYFSERGFGFIEVNGSSDVYFHIKKNRELDKGSINEGDIINFEIIKTERGNEAQNISKENKYNKDLNNKWSFKDIQNSDNNTGNVYPGKNPKLKTRHFNEKELKILNIFAKEFYVTNGGVKIELGVTSQYKYFLIKPTKKYQEMFNLQHEIIVLFSHYDKLESRTFDAIDKIISLNPRSRVDKVFSILISSDSNILLNIDKLISQDSEMQVICPFTFDEVINNEDNVEYFFVNRIKEYFYERDLFDFESPLKKELYFFGRKDLILSLVNRHISGENSGVFGLRKSGKTSILNGIERTIEISEYSSVIIDCQLLQLKRWYTALFYIVNLLAGKYKIKIESKESDYTETNCAEKFEEDIKFIFEKVGRKKILLIFDEIEHLSFEISNNDYWKDGGDFLNFWFILRSIYQKNDDLYSYLVAGTNPRVFEEVRIKGVENPIFSQIKPGKVANYVPSFNHMQTSNMVNTLGNYMGLHFDEIVCSNLTQDYGGHPFLIRQVCSLINTYVSKEIKVDRPFTVSKVIYEVVREMFDKDYGHKYSEMILDVLQSFYKEEYLLLEKLALGDTEIFNEVVSSKPDSINHLIGYGIIEESGGKYGFKIDVIKRYIISKSKYKKLTLTQKEMRQEMWERRDKIEIRLRKIIENQLKILHNPQKAKDRMIERFSKKDRPKYEKLTYKELFDTNKVPLYFSELVEIMKKDWENCYRNIFEIDLKKFSAKIDQLGINRNQESHASTVSDSEFMSFRGAMSWLEEKVESYFS
ncbi:cold shock domain-containing protein [Peribacillus frigoritolerans]|uniref:cold-shock protein n=1 Tax=Peribacillus frigoritolerans TaxID=450367 RepID=UPI003F80E2BC